MGRLDCSYKIGGVMNGGGVWFLGVIMMASFFTLPIELLELDNPAASRGCVGTCCGEWMADGSSGRRTLDYMGLG